MSITPKLTENDFHLFFIIHPSQHDLVLKGIEFICGILHLKHEFIFLNESVLYIFTILYCFILILLNITSLFVC